MGCFLLNFCAALAYFADLTPLKFSEVGHHVSCTLDCSSPPFKLLPLTTTLAVTQASFRAQLEVNA
jgi:hypothetical protein